MVNDNHDQEEGNIRFQRDPPNPPPFPKNIPRSPFLGGIQHGSPPPRYREENAEMMQVIANLPVQLLQMQNLMQENPHVECSATVG